MTKYALGLDYGSDSARALLVDVESGKECAEAVMAYPRWAQGLYCDPQAQQFRQHPLDYIEVLEHICAQIVKQDAAAADSIIGIGIDTTGSTPVAVNKDGQPLALIDEFAENPNAMFVLWKDHTALRESDEINELAHSGTFADFTKYSGGLYSSEWFWSKVTHVIREDEKVAAAAHSWVEHSDWMPALLSGNNDPKTWVRNRCAAGHKAMWHEEWGGLPSDEFLTTLEPKLQGLRERLYTQTKTSGEIAGYLSQEWAERLGLSAGIPIAAGALDAHYGVVGAGAGNNTMCKVMGTSTCDMLIAESAGKELPLVAGICGQVDGSILPGACGFEAGQSAFGDVFAWYQRQLAFSLELIGEEKRVGEILPGLSKAAENIPAGSYGVRALDWFNGRRTPDANARLKGAITQLQLGSDAPTVFRALVESVAFGARAIQERFLENDLTIEEVIAVGGVAKKSPLVMQICADVLKRSIGVIASEQCCALGAAIFGAVVGGAFKNTYAAQKVMASTIEKTYQPNLEQSKIYDKIYDEYFKIGAALSEM